MLLHFSLRPVYRQFSQIVASVVDVGSLYANTFGFKYLWFNYIWFENQIVTKRVIRDSFKNIVELIKT